MFASLPEFTQRVNDRESIFSVFIGVRPWFIKFNC